jgi:hypothetical protein
VFTARYAHSPYTRWAKSRYTVYSIVWWSIPTFGPPCITHILFFFKRFNKLPITLFNISTLSIKSLLQDVRKNEQIILKIMRCNSVGITNSVRLDDGGIVVLFPQRNEVFLCPKVQWLAFSLSQLLNHSTPRVLEAGVMRPGRETDRSSSFSDDVKE